MKNKFKKRLFLASLVLVSFGITNSCSSSSDDEEVDPNSNNYKYTITVNNIESSDYVSVTVVGVQTVITTDHSDWKVNGTLRVGEQVISLAKSDFMNGTITYVIESAKAFSAADFNVQIVNFNANATYNYNIDKNGESVSSGNGVLTDNQDFTKRLSF